MSPPRKAPRMGKEGVQDSSEKDFNYGVIRYELAEVSKLDDFLSDASPPAYIQGIPWTVAATRERKDESPDEEEYLYIYIGCMNNKSQMWSVECRCELTVVHRDSSKTVMRQMDAEFVAGTDDQGLNVIKWRHLVEKGYVKDDKIILEVRIWITKTTGIRTDVQVDFDGPALPHHGLILNIDGVKFHVSREFLSIHSPIFQSMFYGPFDEKEKQEISLKDVDPKEFRELLRVMYPSRYTVSDANIDVILKLADRFQIKYLLDCAEDFLINSSTSDIAKKLLLSDAYRLIHLQGHCLDKLDSQKEVKKLKKTPEYSDLSDKTKVALLEKMFELAGSDDEERST